MPFSWFVISSRTAKMTVSFSESGMRASGQGEVRRPAAGVFLAPAFSGGTLDNKTHFGRRMIFPV